MNTSQVHNEIKKLSGMNDDQKDAVLNLIDIKTNQDMDKVLNAIETKFASIENKFASIENKFASIENKFASIENKFDGIETRFTGIDVKFDAIDHKIGTLQTALYSGFVILVIAFLTLAASLYLR